MYYLLKVISPHLPASPHISPFATFSRLRRRAPLDPSPVHQGELAVKTNGGGSQTLTPGAAFCSPLPSVGGSKIGELGAKMTACTSAHVSSGACVVQCFEIGEVIHDLLNAEAAERREREEQERLLAIQREREALKERARAVRARVHALELRLGLRNARDVRALWSWAVQRIKSSTRYSRTPTSALPPNPPKSISEGPRVIAPCVWAVDSGRYGYNARPWLCEA